MWKINVHREKVVHTQLLIVIILTISIDDVVATKRKITPMSKD